MNFFALVNFGTTTCPEALCPLVEPLPPDSTGAVGAESVEPTVFLLEEEGGLRKKGFQVVLTYHYSQQKWHSFSESSQI
jgi:hypothetical protein